MINIQDIKDYWRNSELSAITDYNGDNSIDDEVIQVSIDDAYKELSPISGYLEDDLYDLYAKRLTICNLLSRLNISPEAVILPNKDCEDVRKVLSDLLSKKVKAKINKDDDYKIGNDSIIISEGITFIADDLRNF